MGRKLRPTILVEHNKDIIAEGEAAPIEIDCTPFRGGPEGSGYCCLDHTADVGIRAWGRTFEDALSAAGLCFFSVMTDLDRIDPIESRMVELDADDDHEMVLFNVLQELLVLYGTDYFISCGIKVILTGRSTYRIWCWGERFNRERHVSGTEVKAITMHKLSVVRDVDKVTVEALLDI